MATLREDIGSALLSVEGDPDACSWAQGRFHLFLAEQRLRELQATIKPLLHERALVQRYITGLKRTTELAASPARHEQAKEELGIMRELGTSGNAEARATASDVVPTSRRSAQKDK